MTRKPSKFPPASSEESPKLSATPREMRKVELRTGRFYEPVLINGRMAVTDGPIKTFPLRGIKDSPPYLHDGRLLTLDDTVEFFNIVLNLKLSDEEKRDLVAYLYTL